MVTGDGSRVPPDAAAQEVDGDLVLEFEQGVEVGRSRRSHREEKCHHLIVCSTNGYAF
jgi:hypothetical protein